MVLFMKKLLDKIHKKFPYLDSVVSLIFGALVGFLLQEFIVSWKNNGLFVINTIGLGVLLIVVLIFAGFYYKSYYTIDERKKSKVEIEQEKSEIKRIKCDRNMMDIIFEQVQKELENDDRTIEQKIRLFEKITAVVNKRE